MSNHLTNPITKEDYIRHLEVELQLSRSANAFICEMASKYAAREKKLLDVLQQLYDHGYTTSSDHDKVKEALGISSEYSSTKE